MKNILLLLLLFTLSFTQTKASHLMGGEITWECIKPGVATSGMYIFTMKVYRDCNGVNLTTASQTITVHNHSFIPSIAVDFVYNSDISPTCDHSVPRTSI